jgi:hypothetical protein
MVRGLLNHSREAPLGVKIPGLTQNWPLLAMPNSERKRHRIRLSCNVMRIFQIFILDSLRAIMTAEVKPREPGKPLQERRFRVSASLMPA